MKLLLMILHGQDHYLMVRRLKYLKKVSVSDLLVVSRSIATIYHSVASS